MILSCPDSTQQPGIRPRLCDLCSLQFMRPKDEQNSLFTHLYSTVQVALSMLLLIYGRTMYFSRCLGIASRRPLLRSHLSEKRRSAYRYAPSHRIVTTVCPLPSFSATSLAATTLSAELAPKYSPSSSRQRYTISMLFSSLMYSDPSRRSMSGFKFSVTRPCPIPSVILLPVRSISLPPLWM
ncbi:hypothetical protein T310_8972 [Rasamsonia emersonii CBS 393.64]|uniref:Uncharacterized protein n=1 Tax=Rasamsonia emersonii (strain ATCC 16479 / CBS 393.64 / IMI 116815) TaxID=1408163 RepID=A0A0F4YI29_RASE3|nr:hypothetical protein T310_8972 [Rasamsonia emersonii CBS 393.64]KKA17268.1 hypothetical protein T310_8972 [Rasamsonia emersonii CBS 393.64]